MRLIKSAVEPDASGFVTLFPEEPEDMWHSYNLIRPTDRLRASAIRKVVTESRTGSTTSSRVHTTLTITVDRISFDPQALALHISGRVCEENKFVQLGQHHTLDLELHRNFTVYKEEWDSVAIETVREACATAERAEIAAVVMQEGLANVCVVTEHMTVLRQRIEVPVPKKRRGGADGHEKGVVRFYETVWAAMQRHFDFAKLKVVLLASPGFVAEALRKHAFDAAARDEDKVVLQAKPKFVVVHCSSGHVHALNEVLKSPAVVSKLSETKFARETKAMERFFEMMNTDENRAWYGPREVRKAVDQGAVGTLLISNALFRANEVATRKRYVRMVEDVRKMGGEALVLSSSHESGQRLDGLGGVAALLTFPLEDLDESDVEEELGEGVHNLNVDDGQP